MSEINPRERERAVVSLHVGEKRAASDPSMGLCEDDQRAQRLITYGCGAPLLLPLISHSYHVVVYFLLA
jgi:hypothetical protein